MTFNKANTLDNKNTIMNPNKMYIIPPVWNDLDIQIREMK
jgi:hypothetical protein